MSPFVQTLLRSLHVPEAEPVDAGGLEEAGVLGPDPLSGALAGDELAGGGFAGAGSAGGGLDADLA